MLLIVTVGMIIIARSIVEDEKRVFSNQIDNLGNSLAKVAANSCVEPLLINDYPVLETIADMMVSENGVHFVHVEREDGQIVAQAPYGVDLDALPLSIHLFSEPIMVHANSAERIGVVKMGISTKNAGALIDSQRKGYFSAILFSIVLITLVMFFVVRTVVSAPLKTLARQARQVGEGNFESPIELDSNDELSVLAGELDLMRNDLKENYEKIQSQNEELEQHRERLEEMVDEALSEITTLSGLLPICSYCKKVRDDKGYWEQIESYIEEHSDAEFSHGMCPDCLKRELSNIDKM